MLTRALTWLALPVLLAGAAPAGDLWTVDESGGGDFTSIPAAVAASADGDTIVVVGNYVKLDKFYINGKGVSLVSEDGSPINLYGISVRNLPAGSEVLLANLRPYECFVDLSSNDGRVVLDGVRSAKADSAVAVDVYECADIVLNDCKLRGYDGYDNGLCCCGEDVPGGAAVQAYDSFVAIYDSHLRGGDGGFNSCMGLSGDGGPGVDADGQAQVYAAGCTIEGGEHDLGGFQDPVIVEDQATFTEYTGPPTLFIGPWLEQQGQISSLRVAGPVGDRAFLLLGSAGVRRPFNAFQGVLHVRPDSIVPMGTIPASGLLTIPFAQPALPPGSEAELVQAQVLLSPPATAVGGAIQARRFFLTNPKGWIVR